jgi:hypothetical protein
MPAHISVGDVVGHDLHAAAVMGQVRIALRAYALDGRGPADVVTRLDRFMTEAEIEFATTVEQGVLSAAKQDGCRQRVGSGEANHHRITYVETLAHQHHVRPPAGHLDPSETSSIRLSGRDLDSNQSQSQAGASEWSPRGVCGRPTANGGSYRAPQFCANPTPPGTRRHSKPPRMAADLH